ncbi:MAG TPA: RNA polymerase sigma factor [Acidimicrobiales bacterium]|nr:RNA polymerase sigma factor [Acidimicrobiales bacterium]
MRSVDVGGDAAALLASVEDDPTRFGEVFDEHAAVIYRYLARRLGPEDAEELVGELFRIAFERRATFDPRLGGVRPWLYGIATRLVANFRRSEARRLRATGRLLETEPPLADPTEGLVGAVDASRIWPRVAQAVAELPDLERDALILFAWEGLGYDEIAASLEIPVGTVRSRLHRARRRLAGLAGPSHQEDDVSLSAYRQSGRCT